MTPKLKEKKPNKARKERIPMGEERESSDNSPTVPNLHHDVVFDIFSRLPVKPLIQYRSVSKPFLSLIHDPLFINTHLSKTFSHNPKDRIFMYYESPDCTQFKFSHYNLDLAAKTLIQDPKIKFPFKSKHGFLRIVGSSNGLICFFDTNYYSNLGLLFLWNPILGKFKGLPDSQLAHKITATFSHMVVGFTFVPKITDFKIVKILYYSDTDLNIDVLVYTVGGNSWRKIDALVPCYMPNSWSENVLVNGSIHWIAFKRPGRVNIPNRIMFFDTSNEVFGEFTLPSIINPNYARTKLSASSCGDSLSLFSYNNNEWEIWSMKKYGVVESWVRQYTFIESIIGYPLRFMENGNILSVMLSGNLAFFDPEAQESKGSEIIGISSSFCVVNYIESLGLLNNGDQVFRV